MSLAAAELVLATTTSTYDTGLLDALNRAFAELFGVKVKVIAVGTGAALELAKRGVVDLVLVHARPLEDRYLAEGWLINRRDVMFNDFVVVGPPEDPAGVKGLTAATEAFRRIAAAKARFLSRGDNSGTHFREMEIWEAAGIEPGGKWYLISGKGMGENLIQASLMGAYTLTDRGTFIAMRKNLDLEIVVEGPVKGGDPLLMNPYGVMAVNPARFPDRNYVLAMAYIGFLTSPQGQRIIAEFTVEGEPLFYPTALKADPDFSEYVPRDWRG
ncbi:molybdenum transporter [Candidatus Acetothermia bacterium]|nr:MAG: molybdenum transporter [Candidatus Acetothermia bacterium]HDC92926.1 molybdenum transporter [Candidatus Acetothermia bacterium]